MLSLVGLLGCGRDTVEKVPGEIGIVSQRDGATVTDRDAHIDFGSVFDSQSVTLPIVVKNVARGTLTLTALEVTSGNSEVFKVEFEPTTISASGAVELSATFSPPETAEPVDYQVVYTLRAENTRPGEETATITLTGRGIPGACELPKTIDFGNVALEDTDVEGFTVANLTQLPADVFIGDITSSSGDHNAFSFTSDSLNGETRLDPETSGEVRIDFRPTEQKTYLAFVKARASAQCPEQIITLTGTGVQSVLSWTPAQVDCGYVTPGVEVVKDVTFTNAGNKDATLSSIRAASTTGEFYVVADEGADPTTLVVPGKGGTAVMHVACKPAVLGPRQSLVQFETNLAKQPQGQITVKAFGGGPDVDVKPSPNLSFGKVAYFASANPPSYAKKKLSVMNVGTAPAAPDVKANLHLVDPATGEYTNPELAIEVTPLNADTAPDEFKVEIPAGYDNEQGLEAKVGKNQVDLVVTITPVSLGMKQAEIKIHTNDPDEPVVTIVASADAVQLPPCDYTVTPSTLNFGLISPPDYRDLSFTIKNNGTNPGDVCLLSSLDLGPNTDPFYSLPNGPIDSYELQPGEAKEIMVRVWPQGQTPSGVSTITGTVDFYVSSPIKPAASVVLSSQLAPSCLTIAPDDLDFGTVQIGCSSQTRSFQIYNTCSSTVTINSFSMQAAAGQQPGGPNCPGTSPCPEFLLTQTPNIPGSGLPVNIGGAPVTFQAKYKPIDTGSDTGAIAISATQGGTNVTYVVSLHGKGDTVGIQTDVYTQDAKPKADILMVIDTSGSMCDDQANLASNFAAFIKYAQSAQVDYHIAVTTTDMDPGGEQARFIYGASHPEKVLTPTTVDVENKFKAKVAPGCNGSATEMEAEPALQALTPPLINSDNAGFLRNDAALAVVALTDEPDQSPNTTTYYLNGFWNIKGFNRKAMFTFNAIAGFSPACKSQVGGGDSGELAFYVAQTNGVSEDICTADWAKTLENLGKTAFGFRTNFFMTSTPDLTKGPIEVQIDNVPVDPVDARGATVWTYDPVQNSINFEPMYVPEPGQTLTITYNTTCYP
ncbi:MAG: choice-of-anchor D domain-containing protein [Myxococcaceae bacterium]|nr:choice-of-anchor D domain-containing protein [Myxococcaceae bacterium]